VKNLDLAQIEAIVSEIEKEKEAGTSNCPFSIVSCLKIGHLQRRRGSVRDLLQLPLGKLLWHSGQPQTEEMRLHNR
jgi:hypothetical protein